MKPAARVVRIVVLLGAVAGPSALAEDRPSFEGPFDVVIAGGTTAAFASAVAAAESGARVALLEPTDWVGGQLTASAVPAVDEAWHKVTDPATGAIFDVSAVARKRENMTPNFRAMLDATGNPGGGWVSRYCFQPGDFLDQHLHPLEARLKGRLVVYRETVVVQASVDAVGGRITSVSAIRRSPKAGIPWRGYDRPLSADLPDWYDARPSDRFDKQSLRFGADAGTGRGPVFLDATEWGELLVLADLPYLQGVEDVDGGREGDDRCGQAIVVDIVERIVAEPVDEPPGPPGVGHLGFGLYAKFPDAWERIWTYRRLKGRGPRAAVGDISLQNWGYSGPDGDGGNDYPFGYLLRSRADASAERARWRGGIDLGVLAEAEKRALAWHDWFKAHAPKPLVPGQVVLDRGVLGTGTGLAKQPYIRDTRRSIGLDGFILKVADLGGRPSSKTGKRFRDRVALGAYGADVHPVTTRAFPAYVSAGHETLPFLIPFRALTNEKCPNLLVAGKTMAQSFLANSATRLHPIEWSTGTASGVIAAAMARDGWTSREALDHIADLQPLIRQKTPIEWTIDGETYPKPGEETPL